MTGLQRKIEELRSDLDDIETALLTANKRLGTIGEMADYLAELDLKVGEREAMSSLPNWWQLGSDLEAIIDKLGASLSYKEEKSMDALLSALKLLDTHDVLIFKNEEEE